jgi:hypothetical protein
MLQLRSHLSSPDGRLQVRSLLCLRQRYTKLTPLFSGSAFFTHSNNLTIPWLSRWHNIDVPVCHFLIGMFKHLKLCNRQELHFRVILRKKTNTPVIQPYLPFTKRFVLGSVSLSESAPCSSKLFCYLLSFRWFTCFRAMDTLNSTRSSY